MASFTRDLYELAAKKENTRLTAETIGAGDWIKLLEGEIIENVEKKLNEQNFGTLSYAEADRLIQKNYNIKVKAHADLATFPRFINSILGTQANSANTPEAGVTTTTFTRNDTNLLPTLTFGGTNPAEGDVRVAGTVITKIEANFMKDDIITYDLEGIGVSKDTPTLASSSYPSNYKVFTPSQVTVKIANDVASLAGANPWENSEVSLSINRQATTYHGIGAGSAEASNVISQRLEITGTITRLLENTTYKTLAHSDDTYRALEIKLTDTLTTIGTTTNPSITFLLPRISTRNWQRNFGGEYVEESFDFVALLDTTDGDIKVTVVSDIPSY